jgi:hypothetical protein
MSTTDVQTTRVRPRVSEHDVIARTFAYVLCAVAACWWTADPDLWGHLKFGLDAIRDRGLTSIDPYSFTSDLPWINHEWLSETAMAGAYLVGGVRGVLALKIALVGGTFLLIGRKALRASTPGKWWVLGSAALLSAPVTTTMRPQLWTVLFLSVVTTTVDWTPRRLVVLWPLIFGLWANLHGGWIVGLGVVGAWTVGVALDTREWKRVWRLSAIWSLCLAATLISPYGMDLWRFIIQTVAVSRTDISEWHPVWQKGATVWVSSLLLAAVLVRRASWSWAALLPVLMLGAGSAKVGRLGGLWVIVALALLLPRWRSIAPSSPLPPAFAFTLASVAFLPSALVAFKQTQCLPIHGWRAPDVEAAGALLQVSGRLMVPFDWGQFAIWHFGPRLKVSFDGRRETVYSPERMAEQHGLASGDLTIAPFIERERPEYVWVPRPEGEALAAHLVTSGYRTDVTTPRSIILTRNDLRALTPAPMSGCFR